MKKIFLSKVNNEEINWGKVRLNSQEISFLVIVSLIAFIVRLYLVQFQQIINGDGIYYVRAAKNLMFGDFYSGISAYWSSFYPFLIGIFSLLFSDLDFTGRFVSVVAGVLLLIPSYCLFRYFYGRNVAYIGAVFICINPSLIQASGWVMTESVYTLILIVILLIGWMALQNGRRGFFFAIGILFGLAFLTKPESIGLFLLFFVLTAATKFYLQANHINYLTFVYLLLGFLIFFLPYLVIIHEKTGKWVISQKIQSNISSQNHEESLLSLTGDGETTMRDQLFNDYYPMKLEVSKPLPTDVSVTEVTQSNYGFGIKNFIFKVYKNLNKLLKDYPRLIFPVPIILFIILGLIVKSENKKQIAKKLYLCAFFFSTIVGYAVSVSELRYLFPVIPILICWASLGIVVFSEWVVTILRNFGAGWQKISSLIFQNIILLIFACLFLPSIFALTQLKPIESIPIEEKKAGFWIKEQKFLPSLIMSSNATVAHYADANHIFLPNEEFPKVYEYAKRKNVNYIVISKRRLSDTPNFLIPPEQNLPSDFKLIYRNEENSDYYIIIYQIVY